MCQLLAIVVLLILVISTVSIDPHWKASISREALSNTFQVVSHTLRDDTLEIRIGPTDSKIIPDQDSLFRVQITGAAMLAQTVYTSVDKEYVAKVKVVDPGHYHVTVKLTLFSSNLNVLDLELSSFRTGAKAASKVNYTPVDLPIVNGEFGFEQSTDYSSDKALSYCEYTGYIPGRWIKPVKYSPYDCRLPNFSPHAVRSWLAFQEEVVYVKIVGDSLHRMVYFALLDIFECDYGGVHTRNPHLECIDKNQGIIVTFDFIGTGMLQEFRNFLLQPDLRASISNTTLVPETWLNLQPTVVLSYWGNHGHWYSSKNTPKHVNALYDVLRKLPTPVVTSLTSPTNISHIGPSHAGMQLAQNDLHVIMENSAVLNAAKGFAPIVDSFTPMDQATEYFLYDNAVHPNGYERTESIDLWAFMCIDAFAKPHIKW